MKSTGLSKVERFTNTEGNASFRLPRPFMTRKRDSGAHAYSSPGTLNTCGSISSLGGSYDASVSIGGSGAGTNVAVTVDDSITPYLSAGMIVVDGASDSTKFRNGSALDLTRIVSVDSDTQITVDNTLGSGTASAMFAYPGNTLMRESPGQYYPGKASIPPPASGKLYKGNATTATYFNYSGFTPGPTNNYIFTTTGGDATVSSLNLLVAGHTTGDGLGSNVRVMWIAIQQLNANNLILSIKSWETGDVVFELSTRESSLYSPRQIQFVDIPMGGVFCEGGAVFQWGDGTVTAPTRVLVGYQI